MATAEPGATMPSHCVDFIDEDYTRRVFLTLHKEIAYTRRADTDEHLDEVRAADAKKRHAGLACDCPRQQCLPGSRRTHKQATFGNAAAEPGKLFRIF